MRRAAALLLAGLLLVAAPVFGADPKTETEHVVVAGATLSGIANRAEVPRVLIIEANGLKAPYTLRSGQKLVIPRRRIHVVKAGETGFEIAMEYGVPWRAIALANGLEVDSSVRVGQRLSIPTITRVDPVPPQTLAPGRDTATYRWPVSGPIRRAFAARGGKAAFHDGIDIVAPAGTAARASAAGTVIFAGEGPKEYGRTVIIHHGQRWTTTYSFLDRVTVHEGERVRAGERVGLVGETGLATEPQLHFEVRRNRVALDPERYLPERGDD